MKKILGLDIGENSIGWAIVDEDRKNMICAGVEVFPNRKIRYKWLEKGKRKLSNSLSLMMLILVMSLIISLINISNWQFWLNITFATLVAMLTMMHQSRK